MPASCSNCLLPDEILTTSGVKIRMEQDLNLRPLKRKCEHIVSRVHGDFVTHSGAAKPIRWRAEESDRFGTLEDVAMFKPFRIWQQEIEGQILDDDD